MTNWFHGKPFLQLLEGAKVHLPVPKNHSAEDIKFKRNTHIFASSIGKIQKYVARVVHEGETEMMDCRWNTFKFHYQIDPTEMREWQPCPHCFAKLIVEHWENQKLIKQHIFLMFILHSELKTKNLFWFMFCYRILFYFYTGKV